MSNRFATLTFDGFRALATEPSLSRYERIGFPDSYRAGHEAAIHADITSKLTNLNRPAQKVVDIGPGCSDLPRLMIDHCRAQGHRLTLVDSPEMLQHLPREPFIHVHHGRFPECWPTGEMRGQVDAILVYSVIQYAFTEGSIFDFLDCCLELLAPGGQLLIGDVPNNSKRKRFFASAAGIDFHQQFTGQSSVPPVEFNAVERSKIDDSVVLALVSRARAAGMDAYIVPQASHLPMANRREDILIVRP